MAKKRDCFVCGVEFEYQRKGRLFCSNRCKQQDKYWSDPEKYQKKARDAYYRKKGESK